MCLACITPRTFKFKYLPAEIQQRVAVECPRRVLRRLACVDRACKEISERVIYREIELSISAKYHDNDLSCLKVLFTDPQKASYVRTLAVNFPATWSLESTQAFQKIIAILNSGNMHRIECLYIDSPPNASQFPLRQLSAALDLRRGHLDLHTLYCSVRLDVRAIVASRPNLRVLGLYTATVEQTSVLSALSDLKHLTDAPNSPEHFPNVVTLHMTDEPWTRYQHFAIYPRFYPKKHKLCETFLNSRVNSGRCTFIVYSPQLKRMKEQQMDDPVDELQVLSIFLRDISAAGEYITEARQSFPLIHTINLYLERMDTKDWEKEYAKLAGRLCPLRDLEVLRFFTWDRQPTPIVVSPDERVKQAKILGAKTQLLNVIRFQDHFVANRIIYPRRTPWKAHGYRNPGDP